MRHFISILAFVTVLGCRQSSSSGQDNNSEVSIPIFTKDTTINLYQATITLPSGWRIANDDTIPKMTDATSRYRFHNKAGKLIYLNYGLSTNGNPAEPNVISSRFRKGYLRNNIDTAGLVFTDNPQLSSLRKASGYIFTDTTIAGFKTVFFQPRTINGYTGIYIDSIGEIATNIADLSFYAENLDQNERLELKHVIESLRLQKFR